jgi:hypothetical protein
MAWAKVDDVDVRHIWSNPDGTGETSIPPCWYAESGVPMCDEESEWGTEQEMVYVRTEVRLENLET